MNTTLTPQKTESGIESLSLMEKILLGRYFLPVLSSIGAILGFTCGSNDIVEGISLLLIIVGAISALTVCPLKLMAFPFKCVAKGFTICRGFIPFYGVADLVAAIVGTAIGFLFGILTVLFAPAFFTIKKFLDEIEN